jgi:uncharacterized FlaG/YvyC family protein
MKNNNEQITERAVAGVTELLKKNGELFTGVEERLGLNLNNIESMWGTTKAEVIKVIDEYYNELVNAIPEKEMVKDKKKA